jgi:hypothetical protein
MPADPPLSLWEILSAGYSLRLLSKISSSTPISPVSEYDLGVLGHCRILLDLIDRLSLERCDRAAGRPLRTFVEDIEDELVKDSSVVIGDRTSQFLNVIADLQMALVREASSRQVITVLPARHLEVEELLDDPARWFGLNFGGSLRPTPSVLEDFQEAARCFAFGFAPSSIVFTLRATEGLIKIYYAHLIGSEPSPRKTWGTLRKEMKECSKGCPTLLLNRLGSLLAIRNEAMHSGFRNPEAWGDEGAKQVLMQCREIVQDMVRDVEERHLKLPSP